VSKRLSKVDRLSVDALRRRRQFIAFDANMERVYRYGSPYTIACLKEYEELTAAIERIENGPDEPVQIGLFTDARRTTIA
jgi:hypothetical protein